MKVQGHGIALFWPSSLQLQTCVRLSFFIAVLTKTVKPIDRQESKGLAI
jgi:hypothetical protein